ncbi:hypothetical protein [Clostridium sp. J1101437_171009_A5]|uniref:hypothetical protein n=1 Tax=Clostridium sp. J1101437_171009_A5 TaxID=2787098 RepID=UPI001896E263|nr:hypothetical protein [Clostridium sp. J1101437_171009_A5]
MQLIGKAIQHNVLGRGIVTGWNETKITICFPEGEKHFIYPDAFTNFLTLKDKTAQKQINKLLDEHRALKEAKFQALKKMQERKALLNNFKISTQGQAVFDIKPDQAEEVFSTWSVSTGSYLSGSSQGEVRIPERMKPHSMCLLTTRPAGQPEMERHIIGAFMVEEDFLGDYCHNGIIRAHPEHRLQLPPEHQNLFWPYVAPTSERRIWGRVALKYMSNKLGEEILFDIKELPLCDELKECADLFYRYYCKLNRIPQRYEGEDPVTYHY